MKCLGKGFSGMGLKHNVSSCFQVGQETTYLRNLNNIQNESQYMAIMVSDVTARLGFGGLRLKPRTVALQGMLGPSW
jgi:hypothetical protein